MAPTTRCLCLILTLWMVCSRPSAAIGTGTAGSSPWWGMKESQEIRRMARQDRAIGDFAAAGKLYEQGFRLANEHRDPVSAARFLISVGSCRLIEFQYRAALDALLEARKMAASAGDRSDQGAIAVDLSSLYSQVWDFDSAMQAAEEGIAASASVPHPYFKASLLLQLGRLHQRLGDGRAEELYSEGIEAARAQGDIRLEAQGWDGLGMAQLGMAHLNTGKLDDAAQALDEAFRLRLLLDRPDLPVSYAHLGALKLALGDLDAAAKFTSLALTNPNTTIPLYLLKHQRGEIRLARGEVTAALGDFESAVELASEWRRGALPSPSMLAATNAGLEKRIFDSFVETAAGEALRTGERRWAAEAFEAMELNRAASLRESLALADAWRKKIPPDYWEILGQLKVEEQRMVRTRAANSAAASHLRLKLSEIEAEVGLDIPDNKAENFRTQTSLIHFQHGLSEVELVLSFHLGEKGSFLWTVSREGFALHRLPPAPQLRAEVGRFRAEVRQGSMDAAGDGERLYRELFGGLSLEQAGKPVWLLSVEDELFHLPFDALITGRENGKVQYLVERHSLQLVPGALWLNRAAGGPKANGWFLGVGDPIYNTADPRWKAAEPGWKASGHGFSGWFAQAAGTSGLAQFNRLVASGHEVASSAASWTAGKSILLTGAKAQRSTFLELAKSEPSVIHLATHVVMRPDGRGQGLIAFGLGSSGQAEFLTTSETAMLHVPGALVAMTGCDTGSGEIKAGAGLLGLTRAWQMAGASAVLATGWPVKDSGGEIFSSFYRYLRQAPAAEALRRSQVEMIRSGTWRASPSYWASYQLTGGTR